MKALYFEEHGDLNVIQYGDVSDPSAGPNDVVVRVRACALNHLDIWVRRGWPGLKLGMPHWCGADVAGEIVEVGRNVTGWRAGQAVIVDPGVSLSADEHTRRGEDSLSPGYHVIGEHTRGGAAEYLAVPAANLAAKPDGLEFPAAAAPLLVSLTAWRMLIHRARLPKIMPNTKIQYPKIAFIPQPLYETTPKWHSFFIDQTGRSRPEAPLV